MEEGLRDYEELKNDIAIKKSERRMLKKQKDEQFAALGEQIEGLLFVNKILGTSHCNNCEVGL